MGSDATGYSTSEETPTGLAGLLAIAGGDAAGLHGMPAGFIPPNLFPGYVPDDRGWLVYIVSKVSISIAFIVVCGRLITKGWLARGLTPDDYCVIVALVFTVALTVDVSFAVTNGGMGKHIWDLTFDEVVNGLQAMYAHSPLFICSMFFIKLSLLLFLYRLFYPTASTRVQKFLIGFFVFHVCFFIICMLTLTLQCDPPAAGYTISLRLRKGTICKDYLYAYYILSTIHISSDITAVALPMTLVLGMSLKGKEKLSVISLFSLGGMACICSVIRMAYFVQFTSSFDLSWVAVHVSLWGQLETTIALVATSVPGIKLLFTRYRSTRPAPRNIQTDPISVTQMQPPTALGNGHHCSKNGHEKRLCIGIPISSAELDAMESEEMPRERKVSCVTHGSSENGLMGGIGSLDIMHEEGYSNTGREFGRRDIRRVLPAWRKNNKSCHDCGGAMDELGSIDSEEFNADREYHHHQLAIAV